LRIETDNKEVEKELPAWITDKCETEDITDVNMYDTHYICTRDLKENTSLKVDSLKISEVNS